MSARSQGRGPVNSSAGAALQNRQPSADLRVSDHPSAQGSNAHPEDLRGAVDGPARQHEGGAHAGRLVEGSTGHSPLSCRPSLGLGARVRDARERPGVRRPRSTPSTGVAPGGLGGTPTLLDTQGDLLPKSRRQQGKPAALRGGLVATDAPAVTPAGHTPASRRKRWAPRHPYGRGARRSWRQWVRGVCGALRARGGEGERLARLLGECGRAVSQACEDCGEAHAHSEVTASCDVRGCPLCARRLAARRVERLSRALPRVPDYVAARVAAHCDRLSLAVAEAERLAAEHGARALAADLRGDHARRAGEASRARESAARWRRLAEAASSRASAARFDFARAREASRGAWTWKLVTVSPAWDPRDERAYGVEGLRERARDAWSRWERVWQRYSAAGLAAAVASLEMSAAGHVHVHALIFGPWMQHDHAQEIAGCHVDVRSVEAVTRSRAARRAGEARPTRDERAQHAPTAADALRSAIVEAAKYLVKLPSALRGEWIAGRSTRAVHPELAAAWIIATRDAKCARSYGVARDALAADRAEHDATGAESRPTREPHCRCCGSYALAAPRLVRVEDLAAALGLAWGPAVVLRPRKPPRVSGQVRSTNSTTAVHPAPQATVKGSVRS